MKIVSAAEEKKFEKRVAITPETAKKYISIGMEVSLPKDYGSHLGFKDEEYKSLGVKIAQNEKDLFDQSDVIVQLCLPTDEKLAYLKENQNLIGVLNPYSNKEKLNNLIKKKK